MPLDPLDLAAIGADLGRLADLLRGARIQLPGPAREQFEEEREEILLTIDGYLEPRIGAPDAPIVTAIVGPSGAGKSTLLNSIAREKVSSVGVMRPTTERPLVWADASHPNEYWSEFSSRVSRHLGQRVDARFGESHMTEHLTVIDTPALDRYGPDEVAAQAVALSDLCIFVTTPTRYADGLAWRFLRRTRMRGIPVLFVLNRLPPDPGEQRAIMSDFASRLFQRELLAAPDPSLLFGLEEARIDAATGGLAQQEVLAIVKELAEVADPVYRSGLVDETVYATARMVAERARALTRPLAAEQPIIASLLSAVSSAYTTESEVLDAQVKAGLIAAERARLDWPAMVEDICGIVTRRAGAAAHSAAAAWSRGEDSAALVEVEGTYLWRHGPGTPNAVSLALESWRSGLPATALGHSKPRRLRWPGSAARAAAAVLRGVLTATEELSPWYASAFPDRGHEVMATARADLLSSLQRALDEDAERFIRLFGPEGDEDQYSLIVDRADAVDARLDGLAGQLPSAWIEPVADVEVVEDDSDRVLSVHISHGETIVELGAAQPRRQPDQAVPPPGAAPAAIGEEGT